MKLIDTNGPVPLERLLIYLRLAIEEARMTRKVVESRLVLKGRDADEVTRARLVELDREIAFLEMQVVDLCTRLGHADAA